MPPVMHIGHLARKVLVGHWESRHERCPVMRRAFDMRRAQAAFCGRGMSGAPVMLRAVAASRETI